jgi:hypothetical protein
MTVKIAVVAPEYVSFYVAGADDFEVPLDHEMVGIVATDRCINVGCLYWNEGDTKIVLGPFDEIDKPLGAPKFDGFLDTPERRVLVTDANIPEILSMAVPGTRTRIRIWTNHRTEPDDVVIALG